MSTSPARGAIRLRGVRHNNLKNFDLDLPLNRLIVITGLSGSGKSSLAFDTLFAEGQRRYIETFSPYARQFFDRMDKPRVDSIEGIPPAIAIEQRNTVRTTRSTVGTMTEICDHMKVLWPHVAQLHCRQCGKPVRKDAPQQIWDTLNGAMECGSDGAVGKGSTASSQHSKTPKLHHSEVLITFDLPLSEKLSLEESLALITKQGYQRILIGDQVVRLDAVTQSAIANRHSAITVVQDRVKLAPSSRARFIEACEQAYHFGKGKLAVRRAAPIADSQPGAPKRSEGGSPIAETPASVRSDSTVQRFNDSTTTALRFSNRLHCADCDIEYRDPVPAMFSFNHPLGACPSCKGFGRVISIDYDRAIPDRSLTLAQGVVRPWRSGFSAECQTDLLRMCRHFEVPTDVPFERLPKTWQDFVIDGEPDYGKDEEHQWPRAWYGVKGYFRWLESKSYKMHVRVLLSRYRAYTTCPECRGARFQPETLLYRLPVAADVRRLTSKPGIMEPPDVGCYGGLTLAAFYQLPIRDALALIELLAATRTRLRCASAVALLWRDKPARQATHQASRIRHHVSRTDPVALVLSEVLSRLRYLSEVGLGYLTLDRPTRSLSGGETERVNLTTCLGTRLVNTLFVLDEPSVGLHPRDTARLVGILERLRDAGNTVVVVEHEAGVMRAADHIVDLGPGHGATGGQVVFQGTFAGIRKAAQSLTGQYLGGRKRIEIPRRRPVGSALLPTPNAKTNRTSPSASAGLDSDWLTVHGASKHNLKDLTVRIPLNRFVCVTGVSGSGKTTLIRDMLLPALERQFQSAIGNRQSPMVKASERFEVDRDEREESEKEDSRFAAHTARLTGFESLGQVVLVDQSALGKTPRSNPAVYIGAFDDIRELFAASEPAKQRGLNASAFSFNSAQGQCERCRGAGFEKIEMQFLSDVFIRCPDCDGRRYRQHILGVKVEGRGSRVESRRNGGTVSGSVPSTLGARPSTVLWSIADVLDATVDEVIEFLEGFPGSKPACRAARSLKHLQEVGLGYLRLGQPINTLSGGESQRLKLASHVAETAVEGRGSRVEGKESGPPAGLSRSSALDPRPPFRALFLFDEPTTGLHFDDIRILLKVFQRLVDAGHSVVVIEHNLDVIWSADWIIDLGPGAGDEGGRIVAEGTPDAVSHCAVSFTGQALKAVEQQKA